MENFDWNGFKYGKFEVKCVTEEDMKDFLQQCEERGFMWASGDKPTERNYYEGEPICFDGDIYLTFNRKPGYYTHTMVTWVRDINKDKSTYTWREVFANIQEGETYEWCSFRGNYQITLLDGKINVFCKEHDTYVYFEEECLFMKKEIKQVNFQEALVELTNGGIVQSALNKKYYLLTNGNLKCSCDKGFEYWELTDLSYEEITGKWNIIKK